MDRLKRLNRLSTIVGTLEDMAVNRAGVGSYAQSLAREARLHIEYFRNEHPTEVLTPTEIAEMLNDWVRPDGQPITAEDIPVKAAEDFAIEIGEVYSDGYWARCEGDSWAFACQALANSLGFREPEDGDTMVVDADDLDADTVSGGSTDDLIQEDHPEPDENCTGSFP
jgi:hypothetical protein